MPTPVFDPEHPEADSDPFDMSAEGGDGATNDFEPEKRRNRAIFGDDDDLEEELEVRTTIFVSHTVRCTMES